MVQKDEDDIEGKRGIVEKENLTETGVIICLSFGDLVKLKCPTPSEKETNVLIFLLSVLF
ncbi:uncharacterized protein G2W53_006324 [Senna tora]|uniref:Uncharacterized protein n=1 Tax=Senna tora TaxID=362788 RepID=A0A835CGE2_9FABA|nr:uncharacterized protein G2W53_006324 [Senna tora]